MSAITKQCPQGEYTMTAESDEGPARTFAGNWHWQCELHGYEGQLSAEEIQRWGLPD
ncbi:hypothetical protein [Leifsonia sp. Le1]|uniref:hypothetical protein n=1 Tax=Leifsonia sp. Le1 TaxID=3404918 RepID=UPI003EB75E0F